MGSERPPFPVDAEALSVLATLWEAGHGAYLVGGSVRDALLGLPSSDWDIATDARPERILSLFPGGTYENQFGTVLARGMEITTFRRDHRYPDHRRPEAVTFSDDIYEDLARRDLTINAIAWGRRGPDATARLLDPADGQGDLAARLVRAVGDPAQRFDEDALRMLRAVRIAARLDFSIEPETRAAMIAHAGDMAWVSEERVGSEIRRMLEADAPSHAIRLMHDTNILATTLPELAALAHEPAQPGDPGATQLDHSLATLDAVAASGDHAERVLLAALLHHLGVDRARGVLGRLRLSGRDIEVGCRLIGQLAIDYRTDWSDADVRGFMRDVGVEILDDLARLRTGHAEATGTSEDEAELRARVVSQLEAGVPLTLAELAVDGTDLRDTLGLTPSPLIGSILDRLLDDVVADPTLNERMTLLTRANLLLDDPTVVATDADEDAEPPSMG